MAWTALTTPMFVIAEVVTAAKMNQLSDNLRYLKGTDGPISLDNRLTVPTTSGTSGIGMRFASGATDIANVQALDNASNSFIFFATNRQFDGSAWQQLNARAGASFNVAQDAFAWNTFPAASSTPAERMRITNAGNLGVGVNPPATRVHIYDTIGGSCFFTVDALAGTAANIIPDGAGDCVYGLRCQSIVRSSGGTTQGNNVTCVATGALVGTNIFDDGGPGNVCSIQITAAGAIQVVRTGGAQTFKVALWITWL